jgi:hypothetical protein
MHSSFHTYYMTCPSHPPYPYFNSHHYYYYYYYVIYYYQDFFSLYASMHMSLNCWMSGNLL